MTLTEIRRSKDMALGELARKVNLGSAVMSRIERGRERPPDIVLQSIADALGVSMEDVKQGIPTKEEAEAEYERFSDMLAALAVAKDDAKAKGFKRGNGGQGKVACPICKKQISYSVASVNGHMWAKCETQGCVSWME